jgi:hypothetical protein
VKRTGGCVHEWRCELVLVACSQLGALAVTIIGIARGAAIAQLLSDGVPLFPGKSMGWRRLKQDSRRIAARVGGGFS